VVMAKVNRPDQSVLVLGASGMIGQAVASYLEGCSYLDVAVSVRKHRLQWARTQFNTVVEFPVAPMADSQVEVLFRGYDVIVNCIGITKHANEIPNESHLKYVNTTMVSQFSAVARKLGVRLVHISTDCVYTGKAPVGGYDEIDPPDAVDWYGFSKSCAETVSGQSIVLRTSTVGYEVFSSGNLYGWILRNTGARVEGYTNAFFTGITTLEFSKCLHRVIDSSVCDGLFNVASGRLSKFEFVSLVNNFHGLGMDIKPCADLVIDRSLCGTKFRNTFGYSPRKLSKDIESLVWRKI